MVASRRRDCHAVEDGSAHDAPAASGAHDDKDVSLQGVALAKKQDRRDRPYPTRARRRGARSSGCR